MASRLISLNEPFIIRLVSSSANQGLDSLIQNEIIIYKECNIRGMEQNKES